MTKTAQKTDVKEITKTLENDLVKIVEDGKFAEYLKVIAKFHRYSFYNTILIQSQFPTATHVAGFQTWKKEFDRYVMKGQKGITILAPVPHTVNLDKDGNPTDDPDEVVKVARWNSYRPVTVFDVSQTDGKPLPENPTKFLPLTAEVDGYEKLVEKLVKASPVPVEFKTPKQDAHLNSAYGYFSPAKGKIVIRKDMPQASTVSTMVHEIAHSILHGNDSLLKVIGTDWQELQAEAVAYTVCSAIGIDTSSESLSYIVNWTKDGTRDAFIASVKAIQQTAQTILKAVA